MTTAILALDLATRTGWATRDKKGTVTSGVQEFTLRRGESPGMRFLRFRAWLGDVHEICPFDLIAYERAHHRGGAATALCVGLETETLAFAAQQGLEHTAVHTATLKKHATGNGRASKQDMIAAQRIRWGIHDIKDDNRADSLAVLSWCIDEIGE